MNKTPASIFNDVIGPVMRGPSSSHTAASARIAEIVRMSLGGMPTRVTVDFDVNGSLAVVHEGQGTDLGLVCGFLGTPLTAEGVDKYWDNARAAGLELQFREYDYGAEHPNTYRITAETCGGTACRWEAISTGGGMIEMTRFEDFPVSIRGDFYELLALFLEPNAAASVGFVPAPDFMSVEERGGKTLLSAKFHEKPDEAAIRAALERAGASDVIFLAPVLPTLSRAGVSVPFSNAEEMLAWNEGKNLEMWELAAEYEAARGGTSREEVFDKMSALVEIMERALDGGLAGTDYADRILGSQAYMIDAARGRGALLPCDVLNSMIKSITAIMETKSSMGVIVAAPTAGSCGCLPGSVIGAARALGMGRAEITRAMLAAGLVGIFIAEGATFAAEVGGWRGLRYGGRGARPTRGRKRAPVRRRSLDGAPEYYGPRLRPGSEPRRSALPRQKRHGRLERPLLRQHGARRLRQGNPARRDDSGDVRRGHEASARTALHLRRPRSRPSCAAPTAA